MKKLLSALSFALLLAAAPVSAQTSIRVEVPNVVAQDEQFNIMFVIDGDKAPSSFAWEPGDDFQLVWGPQKGSSSSISIVNGKRTSSFQTSYTYILMPKRTGTFTLPKASASLKGDTIYSREPQVQVVSGRQSQPSAQGGGSSGQHSAQPGEIPSSDIFMRMSVSRSTLVVGEPFTLTLKLYQRANITGFEDVRFPSFTGFWSQETAAPSNVEFHRESLGDMIYNVADLRSWTLIPQQSGTLVIDPAEIVCLVSVRSQSTAGRSIFDSFFDDDYRTVRKRVSSEAVTLKVSALPQGAPASFGGGVGSFTMDARLSRDTLKAHDAASLVVTIRGRGNVSLLEAPKVSFPPDFESYDVKATDRTDKSSGRTSGEKVFEFPFIPRSHGDFIIPSVEYTYYDINSRRYVTLSSGEIPISVARGEGVAATASDGGTPGVQAPSRKDVRNLGSDVRFISTALTSGLPGGRMIVFSGFFWGLTLLIMAVAAVTCAVLGRFRKERSDVVLMKNKGANKMARRRLLSARAYLDRQLSGAFYEELHRALMGYVSDKLNIPSTDMSKDNIASRLASAGVSEATLSEYISLLEACEMARYSPSSDAMQLSSHYEAGVGAISSIESEMTASRSKGRVLRAVIAFFVMMGAASVSSPELLAAGQQHDSVTDSLWNAGCALYAEGDWDGAAAAWMSIPSQGNALLPAALYCNIGCAFFKMADYPHAILYFERALKADPSYKDARFDLELSREFVQDRIDEVPEFFLKTWMRSFRHALSSNEWCILFFILLAAFAVFAAMFVLGRRSSERKTGFFAGTVALVLCIFCLCFAAASRSEAVSTDYAIMIRPVSPVKSAPGKEGSTDLFILHEGTKVKIIQTVGSWCNIELSDGRQGWVSGSDMEII